MPIAASTPTLRDGPLVLRPWTSDDLHGLKKNAVASGWFETDAGLDEGLERWLADQLEDGSKVSLAIEHSNVVIGGLLLAGATGEALGDTAALSWKLFKADTQLVAAGALQLLLRHAFENLGIARVETRLADSDIASGRVAARAGMLKEGTARGALPSNSIDGARIDQVIFARLAEDPSVTDRGSFARVLNSTLPTKRAIAQALIRNEAGEVLLCQPTYKRFWDLPGGVVDPAESPATAVLREVAEELSLHGTVHSLAAVSWLPPWRGWDDATLFVFDVRVTSEPGALQPREIAATHWRAVQHVGAHTAEYTARIIERSVQAIDEGTGTVYLENGQDLAW